MAYNLLAKSKEKVDWIKINKLLMSSEYSFVEYIPIPHDDFSQKDTIGLSIPSGNIESFDDKEFEDIINLLQNEGFEIFDLYSGALINEESFKSLLKRIKS